MRAAALLLLLSSCGARTELGGAGRPSASTTDDLILWLDARAGVEADASGRVATWRDQSPFQHDATQPSDAARPALDASLDGVALPRFDGVDDHLVLAPGFEDFSAGIAIFIVVRPEATPYLHASRFLDFSRSEGALDDSILFNRFGAGDELLYQTYQGGTIGAAVDAPGAVEDGVWHLFEAIAKGGEPGHAEHAALFRDGKEIASADVGVPTLVVRASNFIARSNRDGPVDSFLAGAIAELRIYAATFDDARRESVEAEMRARWGL